MCVLSMCLFVFFKQRTAYEMRISDWSSDVCSSDLGNAIDQGKTALFVATFRGAYAPLAENRDDADIEEILTTTCTEVANGTDEAEVKTKITDLAENNRSEERRVGKECVIPCRSRRTPST